MSESTDVVWSMDDRLLKVFLNVTENDSDSDFVSYYDNFDGYSSILDELKSDLYRHRDPFTIVLIIFFSLTFLLGLLGNIFVILVVVLHRKMRTLTNVFFVNLTIGDLLVVCICIPITLGNHLYRDWIYGEVLCKVTSFLQGTAVGVSVLSMLFISINRYIAIHIPLKAKLLFTRTKVICMMVTIWVLSIAAVSPLLYVNVITTWGVSGVFESRVCEESWNEIEDKQLYNIFIFVLQFLLPLFVMGVTYMKISKNLWKEDDALFHGTTSGKSQAHRILGQRRRTVRNLIFLVTLFGCSWFPYYIVNIWLDFNVEARNASLVSNYAYPVVQLLALSNSTVNPLCYCFLSKGFRNAFMSTCCSAKKKTPKGLVVSLRYKLPGSDDSGFDSYETVLA